MNELALRARRARRPATDGGRGRRRVSIVLIVIGALMLADVAATLLWQEPLTAVIALFNRAEVSHSYLSIARAPLTGTERAQLGRLADSDARIAYLARREQRQVRGGAALGRLTIPSIGVDYYVVQGTTAPDLQRGPGHYPTSSLPGLGGTVAIAGHRTTYLAPFRNLNLLRRGALIGLRMPYGLFTYAVSGARVVKPDAWWITRDRGFDELVLSACNPLYSASQRIAVFARLKSVRPLGAAAQLQRVAANPR